MRAPRPPLPFRIGLPAGFVAGLIVGLLLGWFFHGVVGLVIRLGFLLILLIPLAVVIWYFVVRGRAQAAGADDDSGRVQVYTWRSGRGAGRETIDAPPPSRPERPDDRNAIDVEFEELKRQVEDEGTPR